MIVRDIHISREATDWTGVARWRSNAREVRRRQARARLRKRTATVVAFGLAIALGLWIGYVTAPWVWVSW